MSKLTAQQAIIQNRKLAEEHAASPEQAFKAPKDKNKGDKLLSAGISLCLAAELEFKLMSYRVHDQNKFMENMNELVKNYVATQRTNK